MQEPEFAGGEPDDNNAEVIDTTPTDSDVFDFGSLLKEAMEHKAETVKLKESRKILKSGRNPSGGDLAGLLADVQRMENRQEWLPCAAVAMFQVQVCQHCGSYTPMFTGLFQRQTHKYQRGIDRWVGASDHSNHGLPQEVKTSEVEVPLCCFCLTDHGFSTEALGEDFAEASDTPDDTPDDDEEELTEEEQAQADFEESQDALAETLQTNPGVPHAY